MVRLLPGPVEPHSLETGAIYILMGKMIMMVSGKWKDAPSGMEVDHQVMGISYLTPLMRVI